MLIQWIDLFMIFGERILQKVYIQKLFSKLSINIEITKYNKIESSMTIITVRK